MGLFELGNEVAAVNVKIGWDGCVDGPELEKGKEKGFDNGMDGTVDFVWGKVGKWVRIVFLAGLLGWLVWLLLLLKWRWLPKPRVL